MTFWSKMSVVQKWGNPGIERRGIFEKYLKGIVGRSRRWF